jgi:hypothetical protein
MPNKRGYQRKRKQAEHHRTVVAKPYSYTFRAARSCPGNNIHNNKKRDNRYKPVRRKPYNHIAVHQNAYPNQINDIDKRYIFFHLSHNLFLFFTIISQTAKYFNQFKAISTAKSVIDNALPLCYN